ncbi:hypothetical protein PBI_ALSFRO_5 [Mycobacterium phage Alsfro]|uniref:hypothetical protein n=1 Tax=Mycobacterium phage Alsfro TaxID=1458724 RepID=UPI00042E8C85|nr:hypothetical protein PBI_ALSFRO_5 [Mycobacterium phage Alsfro]AHK12056.1 hypothetical protein PBI_ALSFRO_5 [Mycobacterium phage Alsfro]
MRGHPVPAPPKRESMRLAAQRLWVGLRLARPAIPARNQERGAPGISLYAKGSSGPHSGWT